MTTATLAPGTLANGVSGLLGWHKALMTDDTLRGIAQAAARKPRSVDIRVVAFTIATYGQSGRGCYASSETVAADIGCNRATVEKYRKQLIELGWFTVVSRNGGRTGRAMIVNITLPVPVGTSLCGISACAMQGRYALPGQTYCGHHGYTGPGQVLTDPRLSAN